ncbi:alpha-amylase family glycosyl hydrolase [Mycoplasmopsis canis]|uniref:alpha-amylase family glycosyl hydrolase n=1 Tax=Mycoplasmopsis canis TaxID=29555 RepID=UPI00025ACFDA|nr:alpha-amylase [Mycoplasmopsis canis UF33]
MTYQEIYIKHSFLKYLIKIWIMKKIKKHLFGIAPLLSLPFITISCNSEKFDKETEYKKLKKSKTLLNWGDDNFVDYIKTNNLNNLSYEDELKNVKNIAPFNKELKRSNVMYQLTVYSFADGNNDGIGDFIGLKNNLDYFSNLGIDTLYLSPFHPSSSYHGYDVIDYTDVAPELGGMKAFDEFLIEAHKRGIRVIMDVVINHTSYEHPWFQKALQNDPKYRNFYYMYDKNINGGEKEQKDDIRHFFRNVYDAKNPKNNPPKSDLKWVGEFWAGMPDLNLKNPEVVKEITNMHKFWAAKGIDGFRYDAFYHIFDSKNKIKGNSSKGEERELFAKFRKEMNEEYKKAEENGISRSSLDAFMFGEWWSDSSDSYAQNNWFNNSGEVALSSLIDGARWKDSTFLILNSDNEVDLINRLTDKNGRKREWIPFLDNHDVDRWINKFRAENFDNEINDQPHKLTDKERNAYISALFSLLSRGGLPTLYNGNEILMQGAPRPRDVNVREAFWWKDVSKNVNFYENRNPDDHIQTKASTGEGTVESIISNKKSSYNLLSQLISLRKDYKSLSEMDAKYVVPAINEVVEFLPHRDDFSEYNTTLRKNDDGTYILIIYSSSTSEESKIMLGEKYKIKKKFFGDNFTNYIKENREIIKGTGIGKYAAFLIEKK